MPFEFLLEGLKKSQKSLGTDKGLAQIGDSIVNLAYSLAKSIVLSRQSSSNSNLRTGTKVNKTVLSQALKGAEMKHFAKNRADAHDMADTVEGLVAYVWLRDKISLTQIVELLSDHLMGDLNSRLGERDAATKAFTALLKFIQKDLPDT